VICLRQQMPYQKQIFRDGQTQVTMWKHEFANDEERNEILEKLAIGSQFDMRFRGLLQFYGDELTSYKRKIGNNEKGTEFLKVMSSYFTDYLEDVELTSWDECQSLFWEEFIFVYFPLYMKISRTQQQSTVFLSQLKEFVHWLDKEKKTSCTQYVDLFYDEAKIELVTCERLLKHFFSVHFLDIFNDDFDVQKIVEQIDQIDQDFPEKREGCFQVVKKYEKTIIVREIQTDLNYRIIDMPCHLIDKGMLLEGIIGRRTHEFSWKWLLTEGFYPEKAKKFFIKRR